MDDAMKDSTIIKEVRHTVLQQECPVCGHKPMNSTIAMLELPMLGEAIETTITCPKCGFKTSDVMITEQNEPVRYTLKVRNPEDINTRVVRSTSGTIRIPELGISIEPGPASESFISNIEGVLMRVRDVLKGLDYENPEDVRKRISEIDKARNGEMAFTFIIEDPFGNSALLSDKAEKEMLTEEEARKLKKGEIDLIPR